MSAALAYFAGPPLRSLTPVQAQQLYDVPVRFGDGGNGPTYVKSGKPTRRLRTARRCGESAAGATQSPWEPAHPSVSEERRRESTSIGAYARAHHCRVTVATATELQLRCGDLLYALTELFRADVDGDGTASIVIAPYMRSMTGTLAVPAPVIALSRTTPAALLVPSAITPLAQSGE